MPSLVGCALAVLIIAGISEVVIVVRELCSFTSGLPRMIVACFLVVIPGGIGAIYTPSIVLAALVVAGAVLAASAVVPERQPTWVS